MTGLLPGGHYPTMAERWRQMLREIVESDGAPSMKGLSKASGLGETYVRDVIKRDRDPTVSNFVALWKALGRSPGAMLDGEEISVVAQRAAPLISWVSAGKLSETSPTPPSDRTIYVPDLGPGDYFALQVQGTSMNRISPENSIIVINRRELSLQRGKPYVFSVRGEATYKLWEPDPPRLEPDSTDVSNKTIFITPKTKMLVVGRVRRTILDL